MGTTPNNGWPYPESTDFVADGATAIENLADAIDADFPSTIPGWMIGCANGGGWLYNPADVGNNYYSPSAGATVTLTTGTLVLVMIHADWAHVSGKTDYWSVNVTGATTIAPNDANAIVYTSTESHRMTTGIAFCLTVNAGSNTFQNKMKNLTGSYAQTVYYNRLQIVRLN